MKLKKTTSIVYNEPMVVCGRCYEEIESLYCSGCGEDHSFDEYSDDVIYCDGKEHYCEKCGKKRISKRKK